MRFLIVSRFLRILLLALAAMSLSRLVFLLNGWNIFMETGGNNVLIAMLHGIRFDAVVITWAFIPIWLMVIAPNRWNSLLNWLFLGIVNLATFANIIDTELFKFTAKRMTGDIFKFIFLSDDALHIGPDLLMSFWYLVVAWFLIAWFTYWAVIKKGWLKLEVEVPIKYRIFPAILIFSSFILLIRGGWQKIPVAIFNAGDYGNPSNSILVLNSPFTFIKTFGKKPLVKESFMNSEKAAAAFNPERTLARNNDFGRFKGWNVVVIIAESLSKEYVGHLNGALPGYAPVTDSIAAHSITCTDAYANGHRSIDGIPAVLSSIPSLMYEPFITSSFGANGISSLASTLGDIGYSTKFFHGGHTGTMGFSSYCKAAGFREYLGLEDYPDQSHYDGAWGIYDHHFLKFTKEKLDESDGPFFATIFTLSSHHPYTVPDGFEGRFPKGTLPIHECLGYMDHSLGTFFQAASTSDWYDRTLFVITADHTSLSEGGYYRTNSGMLSLPLIFHAPGDSAFVGSIDRTAAQVDIFPSVLHLMGYEDPILAFGNDLFDSNSQNFSVSFTRNQYQLISNASVIRFNGDELTSVVDVESDTLHSKNLVHQSSARKDSLETLLKSYIQQFSERAYGNTLKPSNSK